MDKLEQLEARNNTQKDQTNDSGLQLLSEVVIEVSDDGTRPKKKLQQSGDQEVTKVDKPGTLLTIFVNIQTSFNYVSIRIYCSQK